MPEKSDLLEDLLDIQRPGNVSLSPNAQQVVYTTALLADGHKKGEHALSTIWIAETGTAKSARQLTSGLYKDTDPTWSPDGKSIAFISDRNKQGESSAIYILPVQAGGEAYPVTLAENKQSIGHMEWSPDGKFIAFLSADEKTAEKKKKVEEKDDANVWGEDWEHRRLRIVHVATKRVTTLFSRDVHGVDFAWNDDGSKIAFTTTDNPDIETDYLYGTTISILQMADKSVKEICHFALPIQDLIWAGTSLYFISESETDNPLTSAMVYTIDLAASSPSYRKNAYGETNDAESFRKARKDVVVLVKEGLDTQIRMLNGRTLFSKSKGIDSWDATFTTDSDEMILAVAQGDTNSPGEVYTITASGGAMVQLSNHGEVLGDRKFGTPVFLKCDSKSVKGEPVVRLDGVVVIPDGCKTTNGKPEKPLPTVVTIHGGPYGRNTDQFDPSHYAWVPLLLAQGYAILTVNYRGSSGRGTAFSGISQGGMGLYDYTDVIEMVQCAIKEGYADKEKLIVSGYSQGGYLSYLCSVRNGQHEHGWRFKGAIPGAGITNWDTMSMTSDIGAVEEHFAGTTSWKTHKGDTQDRQGSALWEFKEAAEKKVIPPMLILHGEADVRVPVEQARGFRRALLHAKLPFEYVTYPREDHTFSERKHIQDMAQRVVRFVDTHIGGA